MNNNIDVSDEKPKVEHSPATSVEKGQMILVKFGGNAMKSDEIKNNVIDNLSKLKRDGFKVVIVHGGGPAIKDTLKMAGIESEFIGGHRKTTVESIGFIEMALKGQVNGELVRLINSKNEKAVGLSGKDGTMVRAVRRKHLEKKEGTIEKIDLGLVGDVEIINPDLVWLLTSSGYIPVIAPIAYGEDFSDYNVNADMFAGHMAAALKADHFILMTDVDGIMEDKDNPSTLIKEIDVSEIKKQLGKVVLGGMIPKTEACIIALEKGVERAHIINGTRKNILRDIFSGTKVPLTTIIKST